MNSLLRSVLFIVSAVLVSSPTVFAADPPTPQTPAKTSPAPVAPSQTPATATPPTASEAASVAPLVTLRKTEERLLRATGSDREYRIFLGEPLEAPPAAGYPVIYALDGNATFATLVEAARLQRRLGPIVIVGIGYPGEEIFDPRRYFDFTPVTDPERMERMPVRPLPTTGGNDAFLKFILEDLKPVVEKRFKIDPKRQTIFGHSLGGLFVLHALFTQPDSFQNYVAGSPSIWWNNQSILTEERAFLTRMADRDVKVNLFVFVGEREKEHMVHDSQRLCERLQPLTGRGLGLYYKVFDEDEHISVLPGAISRTIRFALDTGPR